MARDPNSRAVPTGMKEFAEPFAMLLQLAVDFRELTGLKVGFQDLVRNLVSHLLGIPSVKTLRATAPEQHRPIQLADDYLGQVQTLEDLSSDTALGLQG